MLRPKECVLAGSSGTHSVCICTTHNNVKLLMTGSKTDNVTGNEELPLRNYSHAVATAMCNPALPSCHLGTCECCPGIESLNEVLKRCYEEMGIDEIQFRGRSIITSRQGSGWFFRFFVTQRDVNEGGGKYLFQVRVVTV